MKYLYLQFLKLRVWFLRRRLRRLGFRDAADRTNAQTLLHLKMEHGKRPNRILRWLEIGLLITGLAIWLTFYLRIATPAQAVVPPAKKSPAPIQGIKNPDQQQDPSTFHYVL